MGDEQLAAAMEIRVTLERIGRYGRCAKHGNEAHHRPGTDWNKFVFSRDQVIVEKSVLFIPKRSVGIGPAVHGVGDVDEMLPKFAGDILIDWIFFSQQQGNSKHGLGKGGHPACTVSLPQQIARWEMIAIKCADVVHPKKAALEEVLAQSVLSINPPCEVQQHLLKDPLHERVV